MAAEQKLDDILMKYPEDAEALIPLLQEIQETCHFLSESSLKAVSGRLHVPLSNVYSVATFYNAFSLKPKGRNIIQVCLGTACHIKGSGRLLEELLIELGVAEGEVTKDGLFSVEGVRCLGCCSLGPAVMINGKTYGNVKPQNIKQILKEYSREK